MKNSTATGLGIAVILFWFTLVGTSFAAWLTHVIHCFQVEQWGFLIAGAIAAPVAIVHGVGLWFNAW